MRAHWTQTAIVGACLANLCSAQSQAHLFNAQASLADKYGWSVACAGDLDGDGRPDVLVGSPLNDLAGINAGAVFAYSGRTGVLLRTWFGEHAGDLFGWSVDGAGDVDGDGHDDIVVGAPLFEFSSSWTDQGRLYLFRGDTGTLLFGHSFNTAGYELGTVVRGLGDVDGDGNGDYGVSAPHSANGGPPDQGLVWFFKGVPPVTLLGVVTGSAAGGLLGYSIEPLFTGNTLTSRILIGVPGAGPSLQGQVLVVNGVGSTIKTLTGGWSNGKFGRAVARVGDLDGDGLPEFAVGEPFADLAGTDSGRVAIYSFSGTLRSVIPGTAAGERFGEKLSRLGDYDGDGVDDFLVGAPSADVAGLTDAGHATILSGATGAPLATWTGQAGDFMGQGLASAGDLNLDGTADFLIGAPSGPSASGRAMAFLSRAPLPSTYCAAKLNSLGCTPQIGYAGVASLSIADPFHVIASSVLNNKVGLAIWSHASASTPFNGATLCVQAPVVRTAGQISGGSASGSDCTGAYDFLFTHAYFASKGVHAGDTLYAQAWSRDQGFAAPQNFGLTDALRFDVVP